jgi:hypothetical protein
MFQDVVYFVETPNFIVNGLKKFGFEGFRSGQEQAVKRILAGKVLFCKNGELGEYIHKGSRKPSVTVDVS